MRYLLINHIAAARGRDAAHLRWPRAWARELAAAGRAARAMGVSLIVAGPVAARAAAESVDLVPDAAGFEHIELPGYRSARAYLKTRDARDAALRAVVRVADVVQLDHGGHPIPLGTAAWPHVREAKRRVVWAVGGPTLPTSKLAQHAGNVAKRVVGRHVDARVGSDLFAAMRDADHVVAADATVVRRLRDEHGIAAEHVEAADFCDADLPDEAAVARRHEQLLDASRPLRVVVRGPHVHAAGTAHVLAALQRCRRLRAGVELVIAGGGEELPALARQVEKLKLASAVRFVADEASADADVLVDASLGDAPRASLDAAVAAGLAPIAYEPCRADASIRCVPRGDIEWLADAMIDAATRRPALAARMLAGVAWARGRTIEASYRARFALAAKSAGRDAA